MEQFLMKSLLRGFRVKSRLLTIAASGSLGCEKGACISYLASFLSCRQETNISFTSKTCQTPCQTGHTRIQAAAFGQKSKHTGPLAGLDGAKELSVTAAALGGCCNRSLSSTAAVEEPGIPAIGTAPNPKAAALQLKKQKTHGKKQKICTRCQEPLTGPSVEQGRYSWHAACLLCKYCGKKTEVTKTIVTRAGDTYHADRDCFWRCSVCKKKLPKDSLFHPFWRDRYCPKHDHDGTAQCCSCERMEPRDVPFVALRDGRRICQECYSSVLVDVADCQALYQNVLKFYEMRGMRIRQKNIPFLLVRWQVLNGAQNRELPKDPAVSGPSQGYGIQGICFCKKRNTHSVVRQPTGLFGPFQAGQQVVEQHDIEVKSIQILYGLPRLLTGSILAHELMHAWLELDRSFPTLDLKIEEGICQVLSHMWLEAQQPARMGISPMSTGSLADAPAVQFLTSDGGESKKKEEVIGRLGDCFLRQIEKHSSEVYGAGFRAAHAAVGTFGLETVLEHMRMHKTLPQLSENITARSLTLSVAILMTSGDLWTQRLRESQSLIKGLHKIS